MKTSIVLIFLLALAAYSYVATSADVCQQDVKQCEDGSYVGRAGPKCEFAPCPDPALCANVTCNSPPSPYCSSYRLMTYNSPGTCSAGACSYSKSFQDCQYGCSNGKCNPQPTCENVVCNSPPASYCVGITMMKYDSPGTCSLGECSYSKSSTLCEYGCSSGNCNPAPEKPGTAPISSPTPAPTTTVSSEISYHGRPPEPIEPEPNTSKRPASGSGGGFAISSAAGGTGSGFAASAPDYGENETRSDQNTSTAAPTVQSGEQNTSTEQKEKEKEGSVQAEVRIEKSENVTVIISGGARAETTEPVVATERGMFIRNNTVMEIKILPDEAQQIAKKAGASVVTSMKIEMKETAIYNIRGYSEKRLFGILPMKVGYEISLNAKEGSVQKVSKPWWGIFAI